MLLRELNHDDLPALRTLAHTDPVVNSFVLNQVADGFISGGAAIFGAFDGTGLVSACWAGANLVPVNLEPDLAALFAYGSHSRARRYASIFGPSQAVLALSDELELLGHHPREVRASQPFLVHDGDLPPGEPGARTGLRSAGAADIAAVLPAAVAMFEEEVGFSPYIGGEEAYRARVTRLIREGHTFITREPGGGVVFKADLGIVTPETAQIQGVWMRPQDRGRHQAAELMTDVVRFSRAFAPVASLYVNSYNTSARAAYERAGFSQSAEFATVIY